MSDEQILERLEDIFIRLQDIKKYVIEQQQVMSENYPNETHGILVLKYLDRVLLNFVKEG